MAGTFFDELNQRLLKLLSFALGDRYAIKVWINFQ